MFSIVSLLFLTISTTALMSFKSVSNENVFIVVRTLEAVNLIIQSKITVSDGTTILKTIPLNPMRSKNENENIIKIVIGLNELKNKGYTLVSSNGGGGNSDGFVIMNYIFEKK